MAANADLVLAYCVASKILAIQHGATLNSALQRLVFLCFFGHGAMTTFDYHRIRKT